jgi:hypothetical protein
MRLPVCNLDCSSSASHAEADIRGGNCHICDIDLAISAFGSPKEKALERAGTNSVEYD